MKRLCLWMFAAVALAFAGCSDDDESKAPRPSTADLTASAEYADGTATVTITPEDKEATYLMDVVSVDKVTSDTDHAALLVARAQQKAADAGVPFRDVLLRGDHTEKVTGLEDDAAYWIFAAYVNADGRVGRIVKQVLLTGAATANELTFEVNVTNISRTAADIEIIPSNDADTYYFDLIMTSGWEGMTDEEILQELADDIDPDYLSQGPDGLPADLIAQYAPLTPGTDYTVVVFGYDATNGVTTGLTKKQFTTEAPTGDAPSLTLTLRAGDAQGNNTSSAIYCEVESPEAVSGKILATAKAAVDQFLAQGATLEALVSNNGKELTEQQLSYMTSGGLGMTYTGVDPGTDYTVVVIVTSAGGKSTVKRADATTSGGGSTESSATYESWLGEWTVKSASSAEGGALTFNVTIAEHPNAPGEAYAVTNWSTTVLGPEIPIPALFDTKTGTFQLLAQNLGSAGEGMTAYYISICRTSTGGLTVITTDEGYVGLIGSMKGDKQSATAVGAEIKVSSGETLTTIGMEFFAVGDNIYNYNAADGFKEGDFAIGPFTMTKKSGAKSSAMNAMQQHSAAYAMPVTLKSQIRSGGAKYTGLKATTQHPAGYTEQLARKLQAEFDGAMLRRNMMFVSPKVMNAVQAAR